ncbi:MAG: NAD-dependent protein deacetylase [Bacteroidales bacterium]
MNEELKSVIDRAAGQISQRLPLVAFTGAGISVESGIPPFRGKNGIWSKYDTRLLEIGYFYQNPESSWRAIRELFYLKFSGSRPNPAHQALASLECAGLLSAVITQNIDNLHQEAGSKNVFELHGNAQRLICMSCHRVSRPDEPVLRKLPPRCNCGGLLKPDFVFFGEPLPETAWQRSVEAAASAGTLLVVGSTGEVMPAAQIPLIAGQHGALIVEINPEPSHFSGKVSDIFLQGKAGEILPELVARIMEHKNDLPE